MQLHVYIVLCRSHVVVVVVMQKMCEFEKAPP
jgi:hypothetical protein